MSTRGSTPIVRPAGLDDAEAIAALSTQLGYPTTAEQAAVRLRQLLNKPDHRVLVVELAGQIAGWAHVERRLILESGEKAELMGLVVDERHRRFGIGKRLVHAVEQWALDNGLDVMTVRSNVARDAAHHFYPKLGYAAVKTQRVYRRDLDAHRT
jgi:GNAT superfamily N-acetyltransferase